jgi:hypothetical protein
MQGRTSIIIASFDDSKRKIKFWSWIKEKSRNKEHIRN